MSRARDAEIRQPVGRPNKKKRPVKKGASLGESEQQIANKKKTGRGKEKSAHRMRAFIGNRKDERKESINTSQKGGSEPALKEARGK